MAPRPEPKKIPSCMNVDVSEPGRFEASWQGPRIHQDHRVKEVDETEAKAVDAIHAREQSTGTQDSCYLPEEPILEYNGWHMMKHRQTDGTIERTVRRRHTRRIFTHYSHIAAGHAGYKRLSQVAVNFDAR